MDLQALRYFRIVAREGSFSQAAQKLNYAQSNLSTKIRQLEGELETPLFRRHAHGVTLTEKGESLLAYADRLVHLLEEAESVVRDDGTAKGSLSVGSMESAAITFIPVLLAEYHSRCPGVSLTVKTGVSQASMRSVLDGTLDGAFVAGATGHAELSSVPVRRERLALFSATGTETTPAICWRGRSWYCLTAAPTDKAWRNGLTRNEFSRSAPWSSIPSGRSSRASAPDWARRCSRKALPPSIQQRRG